MTYNQIVTWTAFAILAMFIKWIIFWTNILVLVCLRQKWLSPNVSNSSEIIQESLVGPFSVHFRGSITYTGASGGLRSHILEFWIIFLIFCEWIILLNILDSIEWIFIRMNILDFVLNWILNWIIFRPDSMKKWIFKRIAQG